MPFQTIQWHTMGNPGWNISLSCHHAPLSTFPLIKCMSSQSCCVTTNESSEPCTFHFGVFIIYTFLFPRVPIVPTHDHPHPHGHPHSHDHPHDNHQRGRASRKSWEAAICAQRNWVVWGPTTTVPNQNFSSLYFYSKHCILVFWQGWGKGGPNTTVPNQNFSYFLFFPKHGSIVLWKGILVFWYFGKGNTKVVP